MQLDTAHLRRRTALAAVAPALTGLSAVIGQVVLMREIIATFNGNELSLAIVLGVWLLWTAIGSGLAARWWRGARWPFAIAACLSGASLAPTIIAIRRARDVLHLLPGELASPGSIALTVFLCLGVFCILAGCMFVFAARIYQCATPAHVHAASYAYLFETAGSALGGMLAALVLLRAFAPLQIAVLVAFLSASVACTLMMRTALQRLIAIVCLAIAAALVCTGPAPVWERATQARMWSGFNLIASADSNYGRISILGNNTLRTIYQDSSVLANIPDPATAEDTAHFALLEHPSPHTLLLIGGGLNGSLAEALKHPGVTRIDYVELDPALLKMAEQYLPPVALRSLYDPRVHIHATDARLYLRATHSTFDEIILSTADPDNAQLNRFYTADFFRVVRSHLNVGGVFALSLQSSEELTSSDLGDFLRCIRKTMAQQFPYIAAIPGETLHLFGALHPGIVSEDPGVLADRLRARHIVTEYVTPYALPFRMMPDRLAEMHATLLPRPQTPINSDERPAAYYFSTVLWTAQFKGIYAQTIRSLAQIQLPVLFRFEAALSLLFLLAWLALGRSRALAAAASVAASGYTLMAVQILLLLAFQSIYGVVYSELALLIGALMAGIALGSWLGIAGARCADQRACLRRASLNQLAVAASAPLLLLIVRALAGSDICAAHPLTARIAFPLLAMLAGVPGGCQFPLATAVSSSAASRPVNLGALYALDLAGGCLGAMLLAAFLLPLFGFWNNAWITAIAGLPPALALLLARSHGQR